MSDVPGRHLVLIGLMGAGKTTTARALAERLGWPVADCDVALEQQYGDTAASIAECHGVPRLYDLEADILLDAIHHEEPRIITAAGSVLTSALVRAALPDRAMVVWLDGPATELRRRATRAGHRRVLAPGADEGLVAARRPAMSALADLRLDARAPTEQLVEQIIASLQGPTGR